MSSQKGPRCIVKDPARRDPRNQLEKGGDKEGKEDKKKKKKKKKTRGGGVPRCAGGAEREGQESPRQMGGWQQFKQARRRETSAMQASQAQTRPSGWRTSHMAFI